MLTMSASERASLLARYDEPHRHYHTRRHLDECLARLAAVRDRAERADEVELALLYHDAVYDALAADNDARSADLAEEAMRAHGVPADAIARVRSLILATRHVEPPATPDEALLVDIDLGILAAEPARFDEYERQVREEYAWVPGPLFRRKRRAVLEAFLVRPRIYVSGAFDHDEQPARENLARSLSRL